MIHLIKKHLFPCLICWIFINLLLGLNPLWAAPVHPFPEKKIVIVIPSYNNTKWLGLNLDSALKQKYSNFRVIYVDDHSADKTADGVECFLKNKHVDFRRLDYDDSDAGNHAEAAENFSALVNSESHFFILVRNINRAGAMANLYRMIHSCFDFEIIVTLDGDDWFAHNNVLKELNVVYSSGEVWYTHGTLKEYPSGQVTWSEPVSKTAIKKNAYRDFKCPSHLRTFYAWLFKKVPLDDFLYDGNFFKMAWDMAIMFPIAEMAAERHAFINRVNYIYNVSNALNDNKIDPQLQNDLDRYIRNKPRYQRLP